MQAFSELIAIVARLRSEGGCPWDRAQTAQTMRPYFLEETYEALDAIDRADDDDQRKEFGDLMFMVVLLARMAQERDAFDITDVLEGVCEKMRVRHPHVFDPNYVNQSDEGGIEAWEARKAKERDSTTSALDGVPQSLPALLRAHRVSEKASRVGFDWPDLQGVRDKLSEEIGELDEALASGSQQRIADELGDVLFTLVNLGRFLPVGAEESLRMATSRFESRFRSVESSLAKEGRRVNETDMETLENRWQRVKEECC